MGTESAFFWIHTDIRIDLFPTPSFLPSFFCPSQVLTKDSVTVSVDAVVYYRVSNATISVANVENAHHSTRLLAQTTLRNILGTKNLHEILSDRESISGSMQVCNEKGLPPLRFIAYVRLDYNGSLCLRLSISTILRTYCEKFHFLSVYAFQSVRHGTLADSNISEDRPNIIRFS